AALPRSAPLAKRARPQNRPRLLPLEGRKSHQERTGHATCRARAAIGFASGVQGARTGRAWSRRRCRFGGCRCDFWNRVRSVFGWPASLGKKSVAADKPCVVIRGGGDNEKARFVPTMGVGPHFGFRFYGRPCSRVSIVRAKCEWLRELVCRLGGHRR